MSPCRAMPTGTRTFQSSICTFSAGTQQVWSLEIESQIESLSIWSHRHLISCLQEWEVFLSPRQGRLDPPKKDGWSAPWNQKHPTSNIWETLKSLQAYNSPPKNGVMNPCLVENYQMIFWYYCWWSKSSRSAPWSWAWKAGNHREVGRLQSWCAEKNGLLGQGYKVSFFFVVEFVGKKKLFFTSTSTVCFLKAEVQQLSHGWLLFPWDRRRCGVQWPSIIWQGKWGNIAPQGLFWQRMNGHSDDSSRARWHLLWKKLPAYVGAAWPLRSLSCLELGLDLVWISLGCQCCSRHFVLLHLFWAMYFIVFWECPGARWTSTPFSIPNSSKDLAPPLGHFAGPKGGGESEQVEEGLVS